jgi:hypothetical protein
MFPLANVQEHPLEESQYIVAFRQTVLLAFPLMSPSSVDDILGESVASERRIILEGLMTAVGKLALFLSSSTPAVWLGSQPPGEHEQQHSWKKVELAKIDIISKIQAHVLRALYFLFLGQIEKLWNCLTIRETIQAELSFARKDKIPALTSLLWVCVRLEMHVHCTTFVLTRC